MVAHWKEGLYPIRTHGKLAPFMTFDIETSTIDNEGVPLAFMYIWQVTYGNEKERYTVYGRTWSDFREFVDNISLVLGSRNIVTYVFNLGYEFQFLRSIFAIRDMFAVKKRVPVRFRAACLECRCAYKLTNMSLAKFIEQEGATHKKLEYDYRKVRYSDTVLSQEELEYCVNDVLGFHEALCTLMLRNGHNLRTVPYTSTGYVRREAREAMLQNISNQYRIKEMRLNQHTYALCKSATRGGNTHANYTKANQIYCNVISYDKVSSYPWAMLCSDDYPVSPWTRTDCGELCGDGRCHLLVLELYNVRLNQDVYIPYISRSKCEIAYNSYAENGRIVYAEKLLMTVFDIDFEIIKNQYTFELHVLEHYVSKKGYLPYEYRKYVAEMFRGKCRLKGIDKYAYEKYKNRFNALFGMMLTDITQSDIIYSGDEWGEEFKPINDLLEHYYSSKKVFLSYQWGGYVTAIARRELQYGIDAVGKDLIYTDTDSLKFVGNHTADIERLNRCIHLINLKSDISPICVVDDKTYELGVFERDDTYDEFITLGAKKYAYRHGKTYGVAVSGLSKKYGARYIEEHGGLSAFKKGAIFDPTYSGRLSAHYDDNVRYEIVNINGHMQEITSNVALCDTSYTLDIPDSYTYFLKNYENILDNS